MGIPNSARGCITYGGVRYRPWAHTQNFKFGMDVLLKKNFACFVMHQEGVLEALATLSEAHEDLNACVARQLKTDKQANDKTLRELDARRKRNKDAADANMARLAQAKSEAQGGEMARKASKKRKRAVLDGGASAMALLQKNKAKRRKKAKHKAAAKQPKTVKWATQLEDVAMVDREVTADDGTAADVKEDEMVGDPVAGVLSGASNVNARAKGNMEARVASMINHMNDTTAALGIEAFMSDARAVEKLDARCRLTKGTDPEEFLNDATRRCGAQDISICSAAMAVESGAFFVLGQAALHGRKRKKNLYKFQLKILAFLFSSFLAFYCFDQLTGVEVGMYRNMRHAQKIKYINVVWLRIGFSVNVFASIVAVYGSFLVVFFSNDSLDMILNSVALFFVVEMDDLLVKKEDYERVEKYIQEYTYKDKRDAVLRRSVRTNDMSLKMHLCCLRCCDRIACCMAWVYTFPFEVIRYLTVVACFVLPVAIGFCYPTPE